MLMTVDGKRMWQHSLSNSYVSDFIVLLMTQVFLKVASSSVNNEDELNEEEYRKQMEQLTDS